MDMKVDFERGEVTSLKLFGKERLFGRTPLFKVKVRDRTHNTTVLTAYDATSVKVDGSAAAYSGFEGSKLSVRVDISEVDGEASFRIFADPGEREKIIEWVDFPLMRLPALKDNNALGNGGKILFPYNEGVLVSNNEQRSKSWFRYREATYPSEGIFAVFPNMICSQMLAYVFDDASLYLGAHDPKRAVKQIDFYEDEGSIVMLLRLFSGKDFGEAFENEYPIVLAALDSRWESAAERYRTWFEQNLPRGVKKICDNDKIPAWYKDSPLVLTYPVRGWHDMDDMKPNALFPYCNALPLIEEIKTRTASRRIMALLMHWEGTAPWAPPYVWPPYGGEGVFSDFADALHDRGDLLGVYCSGFGYSIRSNLVDYGNEDAFVRRGLKKAMCTGADSEPIMSRICTGQRSGYDICPATELGKEILGEAYAPLFKSSADYVQILDQNHGGGQYLCLSEKHGHPPIAGGWMTENMQNMLTDWNAKSEGKLFGCESAASEPYIGNLLFNDNRFELNYDFGTPTPLYSYIYHEYIRNFMGNQVCCPFPAEIDTLRYRIGYSFTVGDSITLSLTPEGGLLSSWSTRDFEHLADRDKAFDFIRNLNALYDGGADKYLFSGRMIPAAPISCESVSYPVNKGYVGTYPVLHTAAYEAADGSRAQIVVNPSDSEQTFVINGKNVNISALSAMILEI